MKPLLDESQDPLELALLREARDYRASKRARALALAVVVKPSWVKSWGLKLLAGGGVALGIAAWLATHASSETSKPAAAPMVTPSPTVLESSPLTIEPLSTEVAPPAIPAPSALRTASNSVKNPPKSTLADEIAIIDHARQAVYASDKAEAIRVLDEYDRRYPSGALVPEARTLRGKANALP